jgi:uncharacterized membrane protein HdeD (DUF308 family)
MEHVVFALFTCVILVGADWALIDGFRMSLSYFRDVSDDYDYKRSLFPRMAITVVSGVMLYVSFQTNILEENSSVVGVISIALFFISAFYPQAIMFARSKPYQNE